MTDSLSELLNGYQYDTLLHIAEFNGLRLPAGQERRLRKGQLIDLMCKELFTAKRIAQAVAALSPLERTVLDRLLLHGGEVDTLLLREELEREGFPTSLPKSRSGKPPISTQLEVRGDLLKQVIASLTLHGLVLSSNQSLLWPPPDKLDLSPGAQLIVPEPVRRHLPQPALPDVEWGRGNLPAPVAETDATMAQRELFIYWSAVYSKPLPLTQMGLVQKRALRQLNAQLLHPEPALENASKESDVPRLYFFRLLLQELDVLENDGEYVYATSKAGQIPKFWDKPLDERVAACIQAWQRLPEWSELANIGVSAFDIDLRRARTILLEQLRLLPAETWLSAERFLNRLAITAPRLLFKSRERYTGGPYYADPGRMMEQNRWFAQIEAAFVGGALSGPLHWLGLVDTSVDGDRLLAFRLNASGAEALGIKKRKTIPSDDAKVIVQPNFEVFALGPVSEAILARLEMFANRVKADRSAFVYALSRETVYQGQRYGFSIPQVIAFLEEQSGAPLPQNVLRTLQEWGEQYERIVFYRAVALCQTANPEMLDALWNDSRVQAHLERRLTPTVAVVKKGRVAALRELLLQREMLPAFSTKEDACRGRIEITPQGELRPIHAGPDLLLETCLHNLAEEREGHFYLSELAVKRALASGLSVQQYLEKLATLHRGPLPGEWQRRIKAWGRYYGKASLQKTVLLEVKDAATAEELLADKELALLLSRFAADTSGRLLQVRTEDLEQLHRLLRERGVELT